MRRKPPSPEGLDLKQVADAAAKDINTKWSPLPVGTIVTYIQPRACREQATSVSVFIKLNGKVTGGEKNKNLKACAFIT